MPDTALTMNTGYYILQFPGGAIGFDEIDPAERMLKVGSHHPDEATVIAILTEKSREAKVCLMMRLADQFSGDICFNEALGSLVTMAVEGCQKAKPRHRIRKKRNS